MLECVDDMMSWPLTVIQEGEKEGAREEGKQREIEGQPKEGGPGFHNLILEVMCHLWHMSLVTQTKAGYT